MATSASKKARRGRRTNQALLLLVPLAVATGLFSNMIGARWTIPPAAVHGAVAVAIAVLTPWKAPIVQRGLGRGRRERWTSLLLLGMIATALVSGLLHSAALVRSIGPLTVMQVHIGAALAALVLVILHYRMHPVPIRRTDLSRRAFLSTAGLATVAGVGWVAWEGVLRRVGSSGAYRRFTGSHERASFDPAAMPVTSWFDDRVQHISADAWTVSIDGHPMSLADVHDAGIEDLTAVLDCTSGWYSEQLWRGVRLDRLLQTDMPSIAVASATGYGRRFPSRDLDNLWLVTEVGGRALSAGHGFPARIVAPGRRGFWWVKWVVSIESSDVPWWRQWPFPIT